MNSAAPILEWLRGWHRGYKFGVLLIAAWAPFMFPENPILTTIVMAVATTLFFVVTAQRRPSEMLNPRWSARVVIRILNACCYWPWSRP